MDTKFQSSFIPKQPVNEPVRTRSGSNILFLISFLIFILGLVGAGGVYLWDKQLDAKIIAMNNNLNQARNSFDQNTIKEFAHLNDKINSADFLLKQHVAPSVLFKVVGDVCLKNVRFTNFRYSNAGGDKISIAIGGEAISYEAVALQSSAFTNPKLRNVFRNLIFSDPDLSANGKATFSFTTGVDPNLLNYYKQRSDPNYQAVNKPTNSAGAPTSKQTQSQSKQTGNGQASSTVDNAPVDNTGSIDLNTQ